MLDVALFGATGGSHCKDDSHDLAVCFEALKVMGIIHGDFKGDNITFVNQHDKPLKVKLIDFGLAVPISEVELVEIPNTGPAIQLTCIMDTHGLPSERMLEYGVKSYWYFTKDQGSLNNGWRLKLYPEEDEDVLVEFVELLKGMLEVDPHRRMNLSNILLQHPFVSLLPTYYGRSL
ncbi:unnamed protein product [Merluccius merluccius]